MWCSSWSLWGRRRVTVAAAMDPAVPRPTTAIFFKDWEFYLQIGNRREHCQFSAMVPKSNLSPLMKLDLAEKFFGILQRKCFFVIINYRKKGGIS